MPPGNRTPGGAGKIERFEGTLVPSSHEPFSTGWFMGGILRLTPVPHGDRREAKDDRGLGRSGVNPGECAIPSSTGGVAQRGSGPRAPSRGKPQWGVSRSVRHRGTGELRRRRTDRCRTAESLPCVWAQERDAACNRGSLKATRITRAGPRSAFDLSYFEVRPTRASPHEPLAFGVSRNDCPMQSETSTPATNVRRARSALGHPPKSATRSRVSGDECEKPPPSQR